MLAAEAQYYKGDYKNALDSYRKVSFDRQCETAILFRAGYANYVSGNTAKGN